jgi:hypothetical protein
MWKWTGSCSLSHTSHSGSHAGWPGRDRRGPAVGGHVDAVEPQPGDPGGLTGALLDAPRGQHRHRHQPPTRLGLHLGHGVVVDLDAQQVEVGVDLLAGQPLPAEPDRVGERDLGVDAALVHHLEPLGRDVGGRVDPVDGPLEHRLGEGVLVALVVDHAPATGPADDLALDDPGGLALDLLDVGHAVAVLGRRPAGPQVVGLGQVRVAVDDLHVADGRCVAHRSTSPTSRPSGARSTPSLVAI